MRSLRASICIAGIQFKKNVFSQRTGMVVLLVGIFILALLQPVRELARDVGYNATPLGLVFLSCDSGAQMIFMAGAVALFSNAPFEDDTHPYLVIRAGKGAWVLGNGLYIIAMSLMYVLFLWIMSVVSLIPYVDLRLEWGKIWGTLAETDAKHQYRVLFEVSPAIKRYFTAKGALPQTILLEWACAAFLGACIDLGNSLSKRPLGTWVAAGIVFFDIMIYNLFPASWIRFSPLSLAMVVHQHNSRWGISMAYSMKFYLCGFMLMIAAVYVKVKRMWRE